MKGHLLAMVSPFPFHEDDDDENDDDKYNDRDDNGDNSHTPFVDRKLQLAEGRQGR